MAHEIDTQWFQDRLAEKKLSQRGLAKLLHLDSSAVSLTLRGRREMKLNEAADIARLLGVPVDEVLQHAGVTINSKGERISVSAILDEHQEVTPIPRSESFDVPTPDGIATQCMAIQCRTAGTRMQHADGWIFFVRVPTGFNTEAIDKFSYVKIRGGLATLAKVKRGYRPHRYDLQGPASAQDVELEWAEPILLIQP
jgi:transcriptional regulator with XRE-family HTH domain